MTEPQKPDEANHLAAIMDAARAQFHRDHPDPDPSYTAAKERVRARAEARRLAAERARATIAPEWRQHYAAQFEQGAREARAIVAGHAQPAPGAKGLPSHEHGVFQTCTPHCPAHADYVESDLPEVIDFLMQVYANEPSKSGLDALLDALEVFRA